MRIVAIVAVTTHGGAAADTTTVTGTVIEAGVAVAELIDVKQAESQCEVHPKGVQEVVADKGYHSNEVLVGIAELDVRSYIAEPESRPASTSCNTRAYANARQTRWKSVTASGRIRDRSR